MQHPTLGILSLIYLLNYVKLSLYIQSEKNIPKINKNLILRLAIGWQANIGPVST